MKFYNRSKEITDLQRMKEMSYNDHSKLTAFIGGIPKHIELLADKPVPEVINKHRPLLSKEGVEVLKKK